MGLVDYSDSESDTEAVTEAKPSAQQQTTGGSKKPFQKVVDRSKPGKILVNLPGGSSGRDSDNAATKGDEPPTKRVRISKSGAFSGFNSFLPPPKNTGKRPATAAASSSGGGVKGTSAPRPGVHLKTGAAPGFSRNKDDDVGDDVGRDEESASGSGGDGGKNLAAPKSQQPTIPAGQKPADEVELVGKPLMFRPLSVSRKKPTKKATTKPTVTVTNLKVTTTSDSAPAPVPPTPPATAANAKPPPKKISLFSISDEPSEETEPKDESNSVYEPLVNTDDTLEPSTVDAFAAYDAQYGSYAAPSQGATVSSASGVASNSLDSIASDMNLSAAARRELFGRRGAPSADIVAAKVISFDTEREYAHNEVLRAGGEQQIHNPVRTIAPGKHNLRQLVSQVHNQREALEESFAKGKAKQNEAGSRYGWR